MHWIKNKSKILIFLFQYKTLIELISKSNICKLIVFSGFVVMVGQASNFFCTNKFPLFFVYQFAFLIILYISYYSIYYFNNFWKTFDVQTAFDVHIMAMRNYFKIKRTENINWLYPFSVSTCVLIVIHILYGQTPLNIFMRIYCYSALYVIVFICTVGYTQYIIFIRLLIKLSKTNLPIEIYDKILPYNTIWVNTLSDTAYKGSCMFFIVGLLYIILFYVFSFTPYFGIKLEPPLHLCGIILFWIAIIIFIVLAFPCYFVISIKSLDKIVEKLKLQRKRNLQTEMLYSYNNTILKQLYINILISLDSTPNSPKKPLISSVISAGIGLINFLASAQACFSLFQMIKGI